MAATADDVRLTARAEYAVRAAVELATTGVGAPVRGESISRAQDIPWKFLTVILVELRRAGIIRSHRGSHGGYALARSADQITVADVVRAVHGGPRLRTRIARVPGPEAHTVDIQAALRANVRRFLESVTIADLAR